MTRPQHRKRQRRSQAIRRAQDQRADLQHHTTEGFTWQSRGCSGQVALQAGVPKLVVHVVKVGGPFCAFKVLADMNIRKLKYKIRDEKEVPVELQRLMVGTVPLKGGESLDSLAGGASELTLTLVQLRQSDWDQYQELLRHRQRRPRPPSPSTDSESWDARREANEAIAEARQRGVPPSTLRPPWHLPDDTVVGPACFRDPHRASAD